MKRKLKQLIAAILSFAMIATMSGVMSFDSKAESELIKTQPFTVEMNQDGTFTVSASVSAFPSYTVPDGFVPYDNELGAMHFSLVYFDDTTLYDIYPDIPDGDTYVGEVAYEEMQELLEGGFGEGYNRFEPNEIETIISSEFIGSGAGYRINFSETSFNCDNIPADTTSVFVMVYCIGEYTIPDVGTFQNVSVFSSIGGNKSLPTEPGQKGGNTLPGDPAPDEPAPAPAPMTEHEAHLSKASIDPVKSSDGSYNMTVFGIPQLKCSICGEIHQDYSKAQEVWFDEILKSATDHSDFDTNWNHSAAEADKPVTIITRTFNSFNKTTLEKLAEIGKDITVDFIYDNVNYLVTVPGDYDLPSLANEDGWAGFMYLLSIFGGQVVE